MLVSLHGTIQAPVVIIVEPWYTGIVYSQVSNYGGQIATMANMNDGNGTTGGGTNSATNPWIKADLGSDKVVNALRFGAGNLAIWGTCAAYLSNCNVESSSNDQDWTLRGQVPAMTDSGVNQFRNLTIAAVTARYWRIVRVGTTIVAASEFRIGNF